VSDSSEGKLKMSDTGSTTPVQRHGDVWLKRDDLFTSYGQRGGKVRGCLLMTSWAQWAGYERLITAGSRHSPQVQIVAGIAHSLGMSCEVHVPAGETTPEIAKAEGYGATVVRHRPGYNSVIVARAREAALVQGAYLIPFGMEFEGAVSSTGAQVKSALEARPSRIVMPVGSAMSMCGVLQGLEDCGDYDTEVVGVCVGADPTRRMARWAPPFWYARARLVKALVPYSTRVDANVDGVSLDPVYEAKCLPFLQPDDLLWIVGNRAEVTE